MTVISRQIVRHGSLAAVLAGVLAAQPTTAGEVVIFDGSAPKAAELARILWPAKRGGDAPAGATRSIRITAKLTAPAAHVAALPGSIAPSAGTPAPAQVQVAATEPAMTAKVAIPEPDAAAPDAFGFPIRFAFNSTEVLPNSRPYLDSVGEMLNLPEVQGKRVRVVGHTDASGPAGYNEDLSLRRAAAVRAYLETRFGVAPSRLEIISEGEGEPLPGLDPYAAANRRVEFHAAG